MRASARWPTLGLLVGAALVLAPMANAAEIHGFNEEVQFGAAANFNRGVWTDVAMTCDGTVIEVHESDIVTDIYYQIGKASIYGVEWGPAVQYDTCARKPTVDVTSSGVIVTMHTCTLTDAIWYRVGTLESDDTISWRAKKKSCNGGTPAVAVTNDGVVIQVFRSDTDDDLKYRVGQIKPNYLIAWHGSGTFDSNGQIPTVAVTEEGYVVVMHQQDGKLAYDVGWLTNDRKDIDWTVSAWVKTGTPLVKTDGKQPSAFVRDDGIVIAAYTDGDYVRCLIGNVTQQDSITWTRGEGCDLGDRPAIAFARDLAVQTHRGDFGHSPLCSSTSRMIDRSRWMDQVPGLMDKRLGDITLPGSHKSGGYALSTTPAGCQVLPGSLPNYLGMGFATTQEETFLRQLQGGIRYFDLRPHFEDGQFYVWNEFVGSNVMDIFDDITTFMSSVDRELVILNISEFCPAGTSFAHGQFIKLIRQELEPYLIMNGHTPLTETTLGSLLAEGPRVIVVYDLGLIPPHTIWPDELLDEYDPSDEIPYGQEGIWHPAALGIYDAYTNTSDPMQLRTDQLDRLRCFYGVDPSCDKIDPDGPNALDRLFMLSWTLTPNDDMVPCVLDGTNCVEQWAGSPKNLHELAMSANRRLGSFIEMYGQQYRPHVLCADYFADARVTDLALELNGAFCAGDMNLDGSVNFADLLGLLAHWGETDSASQFDLDCNGSVGFGDLQTLLTAWGPC